MRVPAALTIASASLALAACGSAPSSAGDFEGDRRDVAEVVEELQEAAQRGEADRICTDLLAEDLREQVADGGRSCDAEMEKAVEDADAFDLTVEEVAISAETATAEVTGDAGEQPDVRRTMRLERVDGRWRITSFGDG